MKFIKKNIFISLSVILLVYLPAILLVLFTDFKDKNLIVIPFLVGTTGAILTTLIRYFRKERMEKNHHKDVI